MQKLIRRILIISIIAINILSLLYFFGTRGDYTFYLKNGDGHIRGAEVTFSEEGVVELIGTLNRDDYFLIMFKAVGRGSATAYIHLDSTGESTEKKCDFQVNRAGTLIRTNGFDVSAWNVLWMDALATMVLLCALLVQMFVRRIKGHLYSYLTLQIGGVTIFFIALTLMNGLLSLLILPDYRAYSADMFLFYVSVVFKGFTLAVTPFVIVFGIAMSISNIMLIRKEGFRSRNALGIFISLALIAAVFVLFVLPEYVMYGGTVSRLHGRFGHVMQQLQYVSQGLLCYFLSFFLSTMICGFISAKRVPAFNQDYIVMLGCGIRKDGTLKPLLKGRVDRAIWFWRKQMEMTGKKAVFIPSGGKGSDEVISEGEAMKNYLLSQGIPEACIHPETNSTTTLQNMRFSKEIIEKEKKGANVIFSTTNYHVFRSGVLADTAGLRATGIGSKTRWYFWPNAFMREFIGLLYASWKFEVLFFGVAGVLLAVCSFVLAA